MPRILVVEDDDLVRSMLTQMMQEAGYEVETASDGDSCLRSFRERRADLVIMDIVMPEKDGWEAIVELGRDFPDAKVIAISGGARTGPYGYLALAQRFGAQRVFAKPVRKGELLKAVSDLLEK